MSEMNQGMELTLRNRLGELEKKGKNLTGPECDEIHDTIDQIKQLDEEAIVLTRDNSSYSSLATGVLPMPESSGPWGSSASSARGIGVAQGAEYRKMFPTESLTREGWQNFGEFVSAVHAGQADVRLRALVSGIPSDGGFLVPSEYSSELFNVSLESEVVRPRARVFPMSSGSRKIPATAIGSHSSHLFGGLVATWSAESSTLPDNAPKFRSMELNASKLTCYTTTSNEWLDDGLNAEQIISETFSSGLSWFLDRAFLTGDGAGKPLGILNSSCLVTVAKESGQAANTIEYANLTKMSARLHPASWSNSVWVIHPSAIPQLMQLSVVVGSGGSHIPVLRDQQGAFSLLGRPVVVTEKLETLGDVGDILFADFSQYGIGMRRELRLDSSAGPRFQQDEVSWRMISRVDGQPLWPEALTPQSGSDTLSPFVTLAERA